MGNVVGEILPYAMAVAISPIPIIAVVLTLLSPNAKAASVGLLAGWVAGIILTITLFVLISEMLPEDHSDGAMPILGTIKIVLGAAFLFMAINQWRSRPHKGEEVALPTWMQAIDKASVMSAAVIGFLLSAVNPVNMIMLGGAGLAIGSSELGGGSLAIVVTVFVAIAASTIVIPVVGYLFAARALARPLDLLRGWLARNNAIIVALLLLVVGVAMIVQGLTSF
ncbi:MAG TPA: GAP family protein [Arachnia sp.]|nr:GAP family protein [Arachnia sp.]HMT86500.1 GAP family protein [Arachnia sp.]